jgi:hypothetical protein
MIFPNQPYVKVDGHYCCLDCWKSRKIERETLDKEAKEVMKDVS